MREAGVRHVTLGDTTGTATPPVTTRALFRRMIAAYPDVISIAHFHDTRGTGLANYVAALGPARGISRLCLRRGRRPSGQGAVSVAAIPATSARKTWWILSRTWGGRTGSTWTGCSPPWKPREAGAGQDAAGRVARSGLESLADCLPKWNGIARL